jgi:hypothetical protein
MKTTLEMPDLLMRQVKAYSALSGQSMRVFFIDAVKNRLKEATARKSMKSEPAWMKLFGAAKQDRNIIHEVQTVIDEEFSKINAEDWK